MPADSAAYVPERHGSEWATIAPDSAGFDPDRLQAAIRHAVAGESTWPRSFYYPDGRYVGIVEWNETGPWSEVAGPVKPRGGPAGLVLKAGRIAAEWGDTSRTDMTFSVAKSYLAVLAGLAVADGLVRDLDEPVGATVTTAHFASAHNARITWRHLLHQASEWQGELWGKSDQVDHNRQIGAGADNSRKGAARKLQDPGSFYEYNDVRVNLLSFCLLQRFGRALPDVLRERVMSPIGASPDWEWHGYRNSVVEIGAKSVASVSGGAHWGGGMFIGARDQARLGLLIANRGNWGGRQILPESFVAEMLQPSPTNDAYGFLWWLNRGKGRHASLSESAYFALGAGSNIILVEPRHDLVAVFRWIDKAAYPSLVTQLIGALR